MRALCCFVVALPLAGAAGGQACTKGDACEALRRVRGQRSGCHSAPFRVASAAVAACRSVFVCSFSASRAALAAARSSAARARAARASSFSARLAYCASCRSRLRSAAASCCACFSAALCALSCSFCKRRAAFACASSNLAFSQARKSAAAQQRPARLRRGTYGCSPFPASSLFMPTFRSRASCGGRPRRGRAGGPHPIDAHATASRRLGQFCHLCRVVHGPSLIKDASHSLTQAQLTPFLGRFRRHGRCPLQVAFSPPLSNCVPFLEFRAFTDHSPHVTPAATAA